MRILRIIGLLLMAAVGLLLLVALGARFNDGPVGLFPGGPLQAGLLREDPVSDWSFATDEETIELQLLSQERSRTTWILVRDGAAFIPCSLSFPPAKSWHQRAVEDGPQRSATWCEGSMAQGRRARAVPGTSASRRGRPEPVASGRGRSSCPLLAHCSGAA
jgi:hypothetical protein